MGGIHQNNQQLCVGGYNEDINHMHCNFFGTIWSLVSYWLGYNTVNPFHMRYIFEDENFISWGCECY